MPLPDVSVVLYDPTDTLVGTLTTARAVQWQDDLNNVGSGSFEATLDEINDLWPTSGGGPLDLCIVRFVVDGTARFGVRIKNETTQHAVDGTVWVQFQSQPGLLSLLDDALLAPEAGLTRLSAADRLFGPMSIATSPWKVDADWDTATGVDFDDMTPARAKRPVDFKQYTSSGVQFISLGDPTDDVDTQTILHFRAEFDRDSDGLVEVMGGFDNFGDVWIDAQPIIQADTSQASAYKSAQTGRLFVDAGTHKIAVTLRNDFLLGGSTPMHLILMVFAVDGNGDRGDVLLVTNDMDWIVTDTDAGWRRAQVAHVAIGEAADRDCLGPSILDVGFTVSDDSDSVAWADDPDTYSFPAESQTLTDVVTTLCESSMDVAVDASTVPATVNAWARKGSDLSGSVELEIGVSLISYTTTRASTRMTDVVSQLQDGTWLTTVDTTAVTALGDKHIEVGLANGNTSNRATAGRAARAQLNQAAKVLVTFTAELSSLVGPQPWADFDTGDTITVPGHRGGSPFPGRVLSITPDFSGEVPSYSIEGVEDADAEPPRRLPRSNEQRLRTLATRWMAGALAGSTGFARPVPPNPRPLVRAVLPPADETVYHGSDDTVPRPAARKVYWIGSAEPANALDPDEWYNADID